MCTSTCVGTCEYMYVCVCVPMFVPVRVSACAHLHVWAHVSTCMCRLEADAGNHPGMLLNLKARSLTET